MTMILAKIRDQIDCLEAVLPPGGDSHSLRISNIGQTWTVDVVVVNTTRVKAGGASLLDALANLEHEVRVWREENGLPL